MGFLYRLYKTDNRRGITHRVDTALFLVINMRDLRGLLAMHPHDGQTCLHEYWLDIYDLNMLKKVLDISSVCPIDHSIKYKTDKNPHQQEENSVFTGVRHLTPSLLFILDHNYNVSTPKSVLYW
jgi:hypothetical protein